ncbi:MAG TPA: efflux RND transporter periplasmic adaptor subunit [Candidatus Didemnitutus sp.]|jgi:RND family efflux transporter MFP subunit
MKGKPIIAAAALLTAAGIFAWVHRSQTNEDDTGDENVPTEVSVEVGQLRHVTLRRFVSGYGTIEPAPASGLESAAAARVAPPVAGVVKQVLVTEGMRVEKGTVLVVLDDRAAKIAVQSARQAADRQKTLFEENNGSRKNLEEAQAQLAAAEAQLDLLHVPSPLAGTVTRLSARPGEAVDLTMPLAEVTDLNRLVVSAEIPSGEAAGLKIGVPVEIVGEPSESTAVSFVSSVVDPANDTVTVRAPVAASGGWRVGTAVRVRLVAEEHAGCLAAPAASVVTNSEGKAVVAIVKDNQARQVPVTTGFREGDWVEVTGDALKAGMTVVTVGAYGLPDHTRIRVITSGADTAR